MSIDGLDMPENVGGQFVELVIDSAHHDAERHLGTSPYLYSEERTVLMHARDLRGSKSRTSGHRSPLSNGRSSIKFFSIGAGE